MHAHRVMVVADSCVYLHLLADERVHVQMMLIPRLAGTSVILERNEQGDGATLW